MEIPVVNEERLGNLNHVIQGDVIDDPQLSGAREAHVRFPGKEEKSVRFIAEVLSDSSPYSSKSCELFSSKF